MHGHQPNLLPKPRRVNRLVVLQTATGLAVAACASMAWMLLMNTQPRVGQTASIGTYAATTDTPIPAVTHQQAPKTLTTGPVYSVGLGVDGDSIRYFDESGRAYSVNPSTARATTLSDAKIAGFLRAWWLPGASRAIIESQKGSATELRWRDFDTGQSAGLRADTASLTVSRDGRSIAYIAPSDDHFTLFTSNADGTAPHTVLQTRITEAALAWPTADTLALVSRRADQSGWELTSVGMSGALTSVLTGQENLATAWSRDGSRLLYSSFVESQGIELFVRDIATGTTIPLGVQTSADKCAWMPDGTMVVCGVPVRSGLSSDVPAAKTATVDAIIAIDAGSGTQRIIWTPPSGTLSGVISPLITESGTAFVFSNLFDKRLFSVPLSY